ncbi:hypothetical protein ACFV0H_01270 [Streptomyces erythrochromogenes]|uniref:hypothetical protein n=1 Tax=Streptomyces erythrochromogenes TaxID=285574 RepID=UPI003680BF2F
MGGRFRLVANEVDVVEAPAPLPNLPVRPRRLEAASGPAHLHRGLADSRSADHTVLSGPLGAEELDDLAEMLGVELLVIDAGTAIRRFTKELRGNQAYHRLAQGM